eukprot:COSAG02_NODE_7430_length_3017_cov_16.257711_7_plen_55_part_01
MATCPDHQLTLEGPARRTRSTQATQSRFAGRTYAERARRPRGVRILVCRSVPAYA